MIKLNSIDDMAIPATNDANPETDTGNDLTDGVCLAFSGAVGGAGVTALCIQTAFELAERALNKTSSGMDRQGPRVCVIDLDFENGSCGHYLDLKPAMKISDLQESPDRIDRALVSAFACEHKCGVDLIATENSLSGNQDVNPETVLAVLDMAIQMYDFIVLDVPRMWQPWTHAAIAASNRFGLVTELLIPSLHKTRLRISAIEDQIEMRSPIDIILNKHERISFRNSLRVSDAEQTLQRDVCARIGLDTEVVKEAINWGIPVGTNRPESRYAKDCRALIETWIRETRVQSSKSG